MRMPKLHQVLLKIISIGVFPGMEENKRLAIQVATFDSYLTFLTVFGYFVMAWNNDLAPIYLWNGIALVLITAGILCIKNYKHDVGRILVSTVGVSVMFIMTDSYGIDSGFEYYYFLSITLPFVLFSVDEKKKRYFMVLYGASVFLIQQFLGSGLIAPEQVATEFDRISALVTVVLYMVGVLVLASWQLSVTQKEVRAQQAEVIRTSNLIALGEMAGGIAHEINNPLQALSLQIGMVKRYLSKNVVAPEKILGQLNDIDNNIFRMAKMVQGLRNLSRDDANDDPEVFAISRIVEDVLNVSEQRIKSMGIELMVTGDIEERVVGHPIQLSQVLINLLNNSVDALNQMKNKWIQISVKKEGQVLKVSVTDSGIGVPKEIVDQIMKPFFTTKPPSHGSGLGLSISRNIVLKNKGRLYYDGLSLHTKFVLELPLA